MIHIHTLSEQMNINEFITLKIQLISRQIQFKHFLFEQEASASGRQSSVRRPPSLQQLNHQPALERRQFVAVVLLQDRRQLVAQQRQTRQAVARWNVEQRVEEVQPQVAVRVPGDRSETTLAPGAANGEGGTRRWRLVTF